MMVHCPQFTTHYLPTRLSHCTLHDSHQTSPLRLFTTCHLTCCHSLLNFTAIVAYMKQITFCFVPATDGEKLARRDLWQQRNTGILNWQEVECMCMFVDVD